MHGITIKVVFSFAVDTSWHYGIMYHSKAKGRGVHIHGGRLRNIVLRSDSTYQHMLKKCVQEIYTEEEQKDNDFYIADSCGIGIWNGDKIEVDTEGSGEECEWTLMSRNVRTRSQLLFHYYKIAPCHTRVLNVLSTMGINVY